MKKVIFGMVCLASLFMISCASTSISNISIFPQAELGDLPADHYSIIGEISAESKITVKTGDIEKEFKNNASVDKVLLSINAIGDDFNYGFVGKPVKTNLSVFERSIALAEYKLIELARYNKADAIICLKTKTETKKDKSNTIITTKASGYAVKIKIDEGFVIEYPIFRQEKPAAPAKDQVSDTPAEEISLSVEAEQNPSQITITEDDSQTAQEEADATQENQAQDAAEASTSQE